jgi:hypothetical protein
MPRGSHVKKGMRPAGRDKGTPNKATVERAEIARIQNAQAQARGLKLGKDMLEDYMMAFHNQAVVYQPLPAGVSVPGREPNPDKFMQWGMLVVQTAKALAEFQSPKFRAIQVVAPAATREPKTIEGNVAEWRVRKASE